MSRLLGVDLGAKRIGLAMADRETGIASPIDVMEARPSMEENARALLAAAEEYGASAIVIGLPLNMDGTEGPQARCSRRLQAAIARQNESIPVYLHDERLTSFAADQHLVGRDLTRKKKKARQDALAAAIMLRSFLQQAT